MFLLGFTVTALGMLCLASAQTKQARSLYRQSPSDRLRRVASSSGWLLLLLACVIAVQGFGYGVGLVSFAAWSCFGAWAVALLVTARRDRKPGA